MQIILKYIHARVCIYIYKIMQIVLISELDLSQKYLYTFKYLT